MTDCVETLICALDLAANCTWPRNASIDLWHWCETFFRTQAMIGWTTGPLTRRKWRLLWELFGNLMDGWVTGPTICLLWFILSKTKTYTHCSCESDTTGCPATVRWSATGTDWWCDWVMWWSSTRVEVIRPTWVRSNISAHRDITNSHHLSALPGRLPCLSARLPNTFFPITGAYEYRDCYPLLELINCADFLHQYASDSQVLLPRRSRRGR